MASAILSAQDFYVYVHCRAGDGSPFYVGKGRGPRAKATTNRTAAWLEVAQHGYFVQTYKDGLTEAEALQVEREPIASIGADKLVNVQEGGQLGLGRDVDQLPATHASQLYTIKQAHQLSNARIAELAGVSLKTVESWLAHPTSANHHKMPERSLRLIKATLGLL